MADLLRNRFKGMPVTQWELLLIAIVMLRGGPQTWAIPQYRAMQQALGRSFGRLDEANKLEFWTAHISGCVFAGGD